MVRPLFNDGQGRLPHPPLRHQQAFLNKVREDVCDVSSNCCVAIEKRVQRNIVLFHFVFVFISEQYYTHRNIVRQMWALHVHRTDFVAART